jgi:hypothetical protein
MPVADTLAIPGSEELHVPPVTAEASVTVRPVHTLPDPVMVPAVGAGLMVTAMVVKQPDEAE